MVYLLVVATMMMRMIMIVNGQCSPGAFYLPYSITEYVGDDLQNHIVHVVEGQNAQVSCTVLCSNVTLTGCDIVPDWLLMIPHTYKTYSINSNDDRLTFQKEFGMDLNFMSPNIEQCSTNGAQSLTFSVTLLNFNASLEELVVICGLKRIVSGASSHAIKLFALIKQTSTTGTTTTTEPATTFTTVTVDVDTQSTSESTTESSVGKTYKSVWPDSASFPTLIVILCVSIAIIITLSVLPACTRHNRNKNKIDVVPV